MTALSAVLGLAFELRGLASERASERGAAAVFALPHQNRMFRLKKSRRAVQKTPSGVPTPFEHFYVLCVSNAKPV